MYFSEVISDTPTTYIYLATSILFRSVRCDIRCLVYICRFANAEKTAPVCVDLRWFDSLITRCTLHNHHAARTRTTVYFLSHFNLHYTYYANSKFNDTIDSVLAFVFVHIVLQLTRHRVCSTGPMSIGPAIAHTSIRIASPNESRQ